MDIKVGDLLQAALGDAPQVRMVALERLVVLADQRPLGKIHADALQANGGRDQAEVSNCQLIARRILGVLSLQNCLECGESVPDQFQAVCVAWVVEENWSHLCETMIAY